MEQVNGQEGQKYALRVEPKGKPNDNPSLPVEAVFSAYE
jgi:hypothetical protein